jgi:two-component system, NarL family, nitrate/nitrite response regulator NarL
MNSTKIFITDDHEIFVESLSMLLSSIEGIEIVGTAFSGSETLKKIENEAVDILICDYMMPQMDGVELAYRIKEKYPKISILMLTSREDTDGIRNAIQAGVKGFISKKTNKVELQKAIKALSNGLTFYSQDIVQAMLNGASNKSEAVNIEVLSSREIEILKLIAEELSGVQIAERLNISHHTVETHRKNLFRKIGVNSTYALIKYALQNGV